MPAVLEPETIETHERETLPSDGRKRNQNPSLVGMEFGRLTVVEEIEPRRNLKGVVKERRWRCMCSCGSSVLVGSAKIKSGNTRSCGCLRRDLVAAKNRTHGNYGTPTYVSWNAMLTRVTNPNRHNSASYVGKGITVCDRWRSFESFLEDMGERPSSKHTIERRNNDGNYEPSNCYWGTKTQQAQNQSHNVNLTLGEETHCVTEWSRLTGRKLSTLFGRIRMGWDDEKVLTTPLLKNRKV